MMCVCVRISMSIKLNENFIFDNISMISTFCMNIHYPNIDSAMDFALL